MTRRGGLWSAGVLVLVTNGWILSGVSFNRRPPAETVIRLTERELPPKTFYKGEENSSLALSLETHTESTSWITDSKLKEWGYDPDAIRKKASFRKEGYVEIPNKQVYLILEFEGKAWTEWVRGREKEQDDLKSDARGNPKETEDVEDGQRSLAYDLETASRLLPLDGGLDPEAMRKAYPDRGRFLVIPGRVKPYLGWLSNEDRKAGKLRPLTVRLDLAVDSFHAEKRWRSLLLGLKERPGEYEVLNAWKKKGEISLEDLQPRYEVTLVCGRRYECWIQDIQLLTPTNLDHPLIP